MKKIINYIPILALICLLTFSCQNDDDVFDQSASERKTEAIEKYSNSLILSDSGWVFEYFVDDNFAYGGYTYIVKFDDVGNVNVWFDMMANINSPLSSFYDIKNYGGPVLSFDTYNIFMHYFANPTGTEYNAKGGDYEFLMLNENSDTINVRGIKYGKKMRLIKLAGSPADYIAKVQENVALLSSASFVARQDGAEIGLKSSSRRFTFSFTEGGEEKLLTVQYVITSTGVRLYEDTEINGKTYQDFSFDQNKENLVSSDGSMILRIIIPPIDLNQARWLLNMNNASDRSDKVLTSFIEIYNANSTIYGAVSPGIYIGSITLSDGTPLYGITFQAPYIANYNLSFEGSVESAQYLNIVKSGAGYQWSYFTHLEPFVDLISESSPYTVEFDDPDNPTSVKLTSVNDPDVWFVVNR